MRNYKMKQILTTVFLTWFLIINPIYVSYHTKFLVENVNEVLFGFALFGVVIDWLFLVIGLITIIKISVDKFFNFLDKVLNEHIN
jgi:hypothetical protein